LFLRLCRIAKRANGLEFLKKHEEWAFALGFYNGIPQESDVTKFIAIVYFKEEGFELDFNAKKAKEVYNEQIASITNFVETMREKMDALDCASLLH
jgi:hypothetical protein